MLREGADERAEIARAPDELGLPRQRDSNASEKHEQVAGEGELGQLADPRWLGWPMVIFRVGRSKSGRLG
jgi:hypothetical protein